MDHRCDESFRKVLEHVGVHDEGSPYRLLSGCQGVPPVHQHLIEVVEGNEDFGGSEGANSLQLVHDWGSYYAARGLPETSPLSILLSFPLTLYSVLRSHVEARMPIADAAAGPAPKPLRVLYLGPEKELFLLPLFRELAVLLPSARIDIDMVGPVACDLPAKPVVYDGRHGGRVTIRAHRGAYHLLALDNPKLGRFDVAVALNAGLAAAGYPWSPTLSALQRRGAPFYFTDYSEYSAEKAAAFAEARGLRLTTPVALNAFRAPLRQPLVAGGSVGFPWLSNGFIAGFNEGGA